MTLAPVSRLTRRLAVVVVAGMVATAANPSTAAQSPDGTFSNAVRFMPTDGEVLYRSSCQACHMAAGEGARGAGAYPALAKNTKLRTARYPVTLVVNGSRAMPPFGPQMTDEQIVAVVNYVRTHFGNEYQDTVAVSDVKASRH